MYVSHVLEQIETRKAFEITLPEMFQSIPGTIPYKLFIAYTNARSEYRRYMFLDFV